MVGDELMGLFEVPVDLLELQVRNIEFHIASIQREIKNQLMRNRGNRSSANAYVTNCVWMNKNSSSKSMTKVYLSWRIMFDMVCEPL